MTGYRITEEHCISQCYALGLAGFTTTHAFKHNEGAYQASIKKETLFATSCRQSYSSSTSCSQEFASCDTHWTSVRKKRVGT